MRLLALVFLGVATAYGQPIERTLQFARTIETRAFQDLVTLIRTMSDIRDVTDDPIQRTVALRAPVEQIAIADWLFSKLDGPGTLPAGTHEYHIAGSRDDTLRLYRVMNAASVQEFQEIATMIRTIADIRYAYTLNAPRIVGLRANAGQIAMAEWLLQEVDQPQAAVRVAHEFFVPNSANDVIRVFYLPVTTSVQGFQEAATEIRTRYEIRRVYKYNAQRAIAMRGTIDQITQAARMVQAKGGK